MDLRLGLSLSALLTEFAKVGGPEKQPMGSSLRTLAPKLEALENDSSQLSLP